MRDFWSKLVWKFCHILKNVSKLCMRHCISKWWDMMKTYHAGVYACTLGNEARCGDARGNATEAKIQLNNNNTVTDGGWGWVGMVFKKNHILPQWRWCTLKLIATLCSWLCAEKQMHLMVFSTDWVGEKEQQHPLHWVLDREHQEVSPGTAGWFKVISIELIPLNTWDRAVKYYIILELQLWNTTSYLSYSCEILHHTLATAVKYYIIHLLQLWSIALHCLTQCCDITIYCLKHSCKVYTLIA